MTTEVFIDSFGARWRPPPPRYLAAVHTINITNTLRNPPDAPALADIVAEQTGRDAGIRNYVLATPGAIRIINGAVHELTASRGATHGRPVQLLVNCWYGRHRAPAIADAIGHRIRDHDRCGCTDGHLLVLPRGHVADFTTDPVVPASVQLRVAELAQEVGGQWDYLASCGPDATLTVFLLHGHLVPRRAGDGLALPWTHFIREHEPAR
ncbi:HIT family protein [Streptomyces huasconensis]|uniref:HIT family protein n=1 Tax=Streptomyces huasconensis TaxID=1854574 RepID=UPI0033D7C5FB